MDQHQLLSLPGITPEEILFIQEATKELTSDQERNFLMMYSAKRKDPQIILICALIGFAGFAGIHRIIMNQIGMGILYFLTGGLCVIGTIVDIINYKSLALQFNQKMVVEALQMVRSIR